MWLNFIKKCKTFVKYPSIKCIIGTVLGIALGLLLRVSPLSPLSKMFVCLPGDLFMNFIECVSIIHIMAQVILGLNGPRVTISRTMAMRAAVYFITTTLIAITIGIMSGMFFKPGIIGEEKYNEDDDSFSSFLAMADLTRNMVPNDLILATFQQYKTRITEIEVNEDDSNSAMKEQRFVGENIEGVNILGLIILAVVVGLCLRSFGEESQIVVELVSTVDLITSKAVHHITAFFPVGLLFMTAKYIVDVDLDLKTALHLIKFSIVALNGFVLHGLIILPLIYLLIVRRNPLDFMKEIRPALEKAMHFSRTAATQLAIQRCEDVSFIDKRVTRFILPLGCKVNQDGTALYIVVSVIFIAQVNCIYLNWSQLLILAITVAVTSLGEAGIPAAESTTTIFTLKVLGIPTRDTCLLMILQWALDCLSCPVNILGDCVGAAVVAHLSKKELEEMDEQEDDVPEREDTEENKGTHVSVSQ